jgi:hypothetical protein
MVTFPIVQANVIMKLQELTHYLVKLPFAFEDLEWTQQVIFRNGHYNTIMNYAVITHLVHNTYVDLDLVHNTLANVVHNQGDEIRERSRCSRMVRGSKDG